MTFQKGDLVVLDKPDSCCGTTFNLLAWEVLRVGFFTNNEGEKGPPLVEISNGLETVYTVPDKIKKMRV